MQLKNLYKILSITALVNSLNINSFSSTLSPDTRYETFNESYINVDDILENNTTKLKIEGNTLVNLADDLRTWTRVGSANFNLQYNLATITNPTVYSKVAKVFYLKPNTEYTISVECTNNSAKVAESYFRHGDKANSSGAAFIGSTQPNTTSLHKNTFVTNDTGIATIGFEADVSTGNVQYFNAILVEGNFKDDKLEYFNGLKSSFEDQIVTQDMVNSGTEDARNLGKYKISIKNIGKNKFDGINREGIYNITTGQLEPDASITSNLNPVRVLPNTTYFLQRPNIVQSKYTRILYYDEGMNFISSFAAPDNAFTTPSNARYINFHTDTGGFNQNLKIQIEQGDKATSYEDYKCNIINIYLDTPLLEGDTIELINGKLHHVKRSKQIVLNGNETWNLGASQNSYSTYYTVPNSKKKAFGNLVSSYNPVLTKDEWYNYLKPGIFSGEDGFGILTSLSSKTELIQWLNSNPIDIVYELLNPIYVPIDTDPTIQLFINNTCVTNNSNIPSKMEIVVDRVANRARDSIVQVETLASIDNISQARYWTNLMNDSILKDSFQQRINNAKDIILPTLSKKTISSNSDIYISMKNNLSLSLDTNNIVFDDVDATEVTERKNALNLTVSSSLPYNIKAYLTSEIYNSDKTSSLDKSILNIKLSSDNDYRVFRNTTDPIVLSSLNSNGTNNSHSIDLRLNAFGDKKADIFKTSIKFEVEQN